MLRIRLRTSLSISMVSYVHGHQFLPSLNGITYGPNHNSGFTKTSKIGDELLDFLFEEVISVAGHPD